MGRPESGLVLITGGSGGLGGTMAEVFAQAGNVVIICGRNEKALRTTASLLATKQREIHYFVCDVTRKDEVDELAVRIRQRIGTVQVLINNAGIARASSFLETPEDLWHQILETNLTGARNCCQAWLPGMLESGWGRIINIASTTAKVGYPHVTAYTASKHGLLGLTRALALETASRGVTVNAICPGYLDNELTRNNAQRMAEKTGKSVEDIIGLFAASAPQNRLIETEEVAFLALFLASHKSAGITGQAISIDGGAVMA